MLCRCINPVAIKSLICTKYSSTQNDEITVPVWLTNKKQEPVNGWAHARHLPPEKREEARRKCRANSKSGTPKQETLLFAEWLLIFTMVPPEVIDTQTIYALYGQRWQVKLVFKRLKSLLDIDKLHSKEGLILNDVWLYGKPLCLPPYWSNAHTDTLVR